MTGNDKTGKRFYCPGCDQFIPEEGTSIAGAWYCPKCDAKNRGIARGTMMAGPKLMMGQEGRCG